MCCYVITQILVAVNFSHALGSACSLVLTAAGEVDAWLPSLLLLLFIGAVYFRGNTRTSGFH